MVIEFINVSMTYRPGIHALKNIDFKIEDGEFVFIIGRSGSGKSTLVKLLTCEEYPTAGKVYIDEYDISHLKRSLVPFLRRNIGMIFQDFRLITSKTVYENVAFAMEIVGADNALIKKRVPMVLSIVGLRKKANMHPNQLSGGEQQRVAIARAMVNNPTLILADEPTGNLDPINSEAVMALLQEINDNGTTVVVCTHDATMVNKLRRRVIEISGGRIVRDEKLGEYNLSSEILSSIKERAAVSQPQKEKTKEKEQAPSPFVRNINIKFSQFGLDEDQEENTEDVIIEEDKKKEKEEKKEKKEKKKEPDIPPEEIDEENKEIQEPEEDSAQEALRIAVEYYMKKAKKYEDIPFNEYEKRVRSEEVNKEESGIETGFIDLIKPKRVDKGNSTEDSE